MRTSKPSEKTKDLSKNTPINSKNNNSKNEITFENSSLDIPNKFNIDYSLSTYRNISHTYTTDLSTDISQKNTIDSSNDISEISESL